MNPNIDPNMAGRDTPLLPYYEEDNVDKITVPNKVASCLFVYAKHTDNVDSRKPALLTAKGKAGVTDKIVSSILENLVKQEHADATHPGLGKGYANYFWRPCSFS